MIINVMYLVQELSFLICNLIKFFIFFKELLKIMHFRNKIALILLNVINQASGIKKN